MNGLISTFSTADSTTGSMGFMIGSEGFVVGSAILIVDSGAFVIGSGALVIYSGALVIYSGAFVIYSDATRSESFKTGSGALFSADSNLTNSLFCCAKGSGALTKVSVCSVYSWNNNLGDCLFAQTSCHGF